MIPSTKTYNGSRIVSLQIETTHDQCCPIGDPLRITHFCSIKLFEWLKIICFIQYLVLWVGSGLPGNPVQATGVCGREAAPTAPIRRRLPRWPSDLRIPPLCDCAPSRCVRLGGEKLSRLSSAAIRAKLSPTARRASMRDNKTGYVESCS